MTRSAVVSSFTAIAAGAIATLAAGDGVECVVITPGALLDNGSFVLIAAPAVGQMQRSDFSATVGPLACFNEVSPCLFGDLSCDGCVDGADLGILLGSWNSVGPADLNDDGTVNGADMGLLLGAWGNGCL